MRRQSTELEVHVMESLLLPLIPRQAQGEA
jgi:hypothetical protein